MASLPFPKIRLTVLEFKGKCYHNYRVGQQFIFDDFTHPPKHFCLGIAQTVFPVIYALTFGAQFDELENASSATAMCPDNGKMKFLAELLDEDGNVIVTSRTPGKGSTAKRLRATVEEVFGNGCPCGCTRGDTTDIDGLTVPRGFCGIAYATMFPAIYALTHGAVFKHMNPSNQINTVVCPRGGTRFTVERIET